jgi:hypothetical protein
LGPGWRRRHLSQPHRDQCCFSLAGLSFTINNTGSADAGPSTRASSSLPTRA